MTEQSTQSQPAQDTREYSVTELDSYVAQGQITQAQRDQIFASQIERRAAAQAQQVATQIIETTTRENSLDGELQQYAQVSRELTQEGSPLRQRVASEFEYLVARGAPRDLSTELAAVRAVMGPLERARQYAQGRVRGAEMGRDSFGGRPMSPKERREDDAWNRLSVTQKQFYERQINNGLYPDKTAVLKEVNWRRPTQRSA